MARKQRIHYSGAFYHVILRGNAGGPIFFSDSDRYRLYLILQYAVEKFRCRIHAFCLMQNHLHLVMQVEDVPLSRIMQNISLRFTKWINYTHVRTGHLFQGRYKALLIDADAYLLELVRYVHLNPVRAGASVILTEYPWNGHRGYLGVEQIPWLTTDYVLSMFSAQFDRSLAAYEQFVNDGLVEGTRGEFYSGSCEGRILGDEQFTDEILEKVQQQVERQYSLEDVLEAVCAHYRLSPELLQVAGKARPMSEARGVAAAIVQESSHLRLIDLAKQLKRDSSALAKASRRLAVSDKVSEIMIGLEVRKGKNQ
ncbi:MAG TPA: transposase [Desulfuromonadales bacterium]|nr:transposase [Desulfuromonadales bacterium]